MFPLRLFARIETRHWLIAFGIIFRVFLELSYKDFVSPMYEYAGFEFVFSLGKYVESWGIYTALLLLLPAKAHKPSDYLICLAFSVYMAPLLVFYGLADPCRWAMYCVLIQYAVMCLVPRIPSFSIRGVKNGQSIALGMSISGIIIASIWMIEATGGTKFNLDLDAVYEFREDANNTIYTGVLGYVVIWATTVCGPFVLMLALRDQRYFITSVVLALHVFWFGITSHKSVLFYPAQVIFLYILFKHSRALVLLFIGQAAIVLVSLINYYTTDSLFMSGMFIRRAFFVPSHLTFTYFDFFSVNPFVFWSDSCLSWLLHYPYDDSVALVIGNYLNDPSLWANNSFFSTGYMHAGLPGVILYGLIAGLILKITDNLVNMNTQLWMSLSIVIVPFYSLFTSADLMTTILTHGLGFGIVVLFLMGKTDQSSKSPHPNSQLQNPLHSSGSL